MKKVKLKRVKCEKIAKIKPLILLELGVFVIARHEAIQFIKIIPIIMLQKIKKLFIYPFLDIYTLLKSNRTESILSIWFIACVLIMLTIYFSNDYNLNLNLVGDAMGGIFGTLISTIVLVFVVESYKLQKDELKKTTEALEGQEKAMNEQKIQTMVISLLELSQNHLNNFRDALISSKFSTPQGRDLVSLYVHGSPDIHTDIREGILNGAIYYFRTLKYIEELIEKESGGDTNTINTYTNLLESQITENLRTLHGLILSSKEGSDKEKITFKYVFSNTSIPVKDKPNNKRPLKILSPM